MTQQVQKFWDKQARRYARAERKFAPVYKDIIVKTSKYLSYSDNVLDYGCAIGTKTIELAGKVQHILGLDISSGMISEAIRKKDELKISNITFSQGTIFKTDLEKNSFDRIIAYGIIHLLPDKEKVIQRLYELLSPGGLLISTVPCMKDKMAVKTRIEVSVCLVMKRLGVFPLHLNLFTAADVEKLLSDQGFQIIESEKMVDGIPAIFIVARK